MRREVFVSNKSHVYCCEDHFKDSQEYSIMASEHYKYFWGNTNSNGRRALTGAERAKLFRQRKKLSKENSSYTTIQSSLFENNKFIVLNNTSSSMIMNSETRPQQHIEFIMNTIIEEKVILSFNIIQELFFDDDDE
ncbi:hypothetical protein JTB14_032344 [Gonioctena quinquepunctata]|nr:hypothetical protein JTB14_032344 [Gonioctena quinquepunctata]